jgi:chaperonin GroES
LSGFAARIRLVLRINLKNGGILKMTIKPLLDKVLVKMLEADDKTEGGIILTNNAKEKPQVAEVIAVGPGGVVNDKNVEMYIQVGQKVLMSKYSGTQVKVDGEEYTILKQEDILAVVE